MGVLASATDLQGNPTAPIGLVLIAAIASIIFIVLAVIRLWKEARGLAILFASWTIIYFIISSFHGAIFPSNTNIIILNITKGVDLIIFFWVIIKLFKMK